MKHKTFQNKHNSDLRFGDEFLDIISKAGPIKEK